MSRKSSIVTGAAIGLLAYLIFALVPSLVWGGYAGALLAGDLSSTAARSTFLGQALTVLGTVLGAAATCALFIAVGAGLGAAVTSAATFMGHPPAHQEHPSRKP